MGDWEQVICLKNEIEEKLNCTGEIWTVPEETLSFADGLFWMYMAVSIFLVLFAGLMSGLTLGLLSLDLGGSDPKKKQYASDIMPIVSRHHQLLVTLLLANAACMEALPICLDKISDPITAILVSVTAVLFFGEIIPQAGSKLRYVVWGLIFILWPLNYPLGLLLDYLLGVEHGTFYERDEFRQLVDLHSKESALQVDEGTIIKGALDLATLNVGNKMIPLEKVFMIDANAHLDKATLSELEIHGHSRVPVYRQNRGNVIGILLIKSLVSKNADESRPIHDLLLGRVVRVTQDMGMYDLLNIFQTGAGHLAVVYPPSKQGQKAPSWLTRPPSGNSGTTSPRANAHGDDEADNDIPEAVGIITLEDVIETLLREEIRDETDYARLLAKPRTRTILSASTGATALPTSSFYTTESPRYPTTFDGVPSSNRRTKTFSEQLLGVPKTGSVEPLAHGAYVALEDV